MKKQIKYCIALIGIAIATNAFAQVTLHEHRYSTSVNDGNYIVRYKVDGKKGKIDEPHKIPMNQRILIVGTKRKAQRATDVITKENLNYELLDKLVWEECNKYRKSLRIPVTTWNETTHKASSHHSYYQAYIDDLEHGETKDIPGKENEQKHYKKVYQQAAEICLYTHIALGRTTYREAAQQAIEQWKNSPGHDRIMRSKSYSFNAFGCSLKQYSSDFLTADNLKKHNPKLFQKIKRTVPCLAKELEEEEESEVQSVLFYCTGNFTRVDPSRYIVAQGSP